MVLKDSCSYDTKWMLWKDNKIKAGCFFKNPASGLDITVEGKIKYWGNITKM